MGLETWGHEKDKCVVKIELNLLKVNRISNIQIFTVMSLRGYFVMPLGGTDCIVIVDFSLDTKFFKLVELYSGHGLRNGKLFSGATGEERLRGCF